MDIKMRTVLVGAVFAALSVRFGFAETPRPIKNLRSLTTVSSPISCIYYKVDVLRELEGGTALPPLTEHQCDLSEATVNAQGKIVRRISLLNLNNLPYDVFEGLESGRTLLTFADAVIDNHVLDITDLAVSAQTAVNQDNLFQDRTEDGTDAGLRRLQTTDARTILVCRVKSDVQTSPTVSDETSADALALSDSFFGTNGKSLNLQSQMDACSYGRQTFSPFLDTSLPADGVIQINVTTGPTYPEAVADLVDLIEIEIYNKFENTSLSNAYNLSLPFDHIMICLPKGAVSFNLAAADQNGPFSIYKDDVCLYPSVLQHELGHNLGLEHSGHMHNDTAYDFYGDISGAMGSSNALQDSPRMCFNGANSWQLGWYQEKHATFEPLEDPIWTGDLVGVAEFGEPSSDELFVILKIEGDIDDGTTPTAPATTTTTTTLAATTAAPPAQCKLLNFPCDNDCCDGCVCLPFGRISRCFNDASQATPSNPYPCPDLYSRRLSVSNTLDYYVAFNRKVGFNNDTKEGGDQVMVTSRGVGPDLPTKLHAILSAGMSFPIADFGGTGNTVTISVLSIDLASVPARATVEITSDVAFPTESPAPSLSPSDVPSSMPSSAPSVFECDEDADCGVMLACSSSHQYCDAVTLKCLPVPGQCDCNDACDGGESKNSCPSDCIQNDDTLETTFAGGINGQAGNMWDIETYNEIQVLSFAVHTTRTDHFRVLVYTKVGTYVGFETDPSAWTLIQDRTDVRGEGQGFPSPVRPLDKPLVIPAGQRQAFYVTQTTQEMEYTDGIAVGAPYVSSNDFVIYQGAGKQYDASKGGFGLGTYQPVIWNGVMSYVAVPPVDPPTPAPVDPTPSPVDPLSTTSCPPGEVGMTIDILTDNYPGETTYELKQGETMVASGGPFDAQATWYNEEVCLLSASTYTFTMNDSYGDGICCGTYGDGEYTVTMGSEVVASGGVFGSSDTTSFSTPAISQAQQETSQPSESPSDAPSPGPSLSIPPSDEPSPGPTLSVAPSRNPSDEPSSAPSPGPSLSSAPSGGPTVGPTLSVAPSSDPSSEPSLSIAPSDAPTNGPTLSIAPSRNPSSKPSDAPSPEPSLSIAPSNGPTLGPTLSNAPSGDPTNEPSLSLAPSDAPTTGPTLSIAPSNKPSKEPTPAPIPLCNACDCRDNKDECEDYKDDGCKWDKKKDICKFKQKKRARERRVRGRIRG